MADVSTQIITSGTRVVYTATATVTIYRLSVSNPSASATVSIYKRVQGVDVNIDAVAMTIATGSVNIITDPLVLKAGWSIVILTNQTVHVDINIP